MIEHYLDLFSAYAINHPHIAELVTFFIALAESLPLIGTIIPGSITMTVIGILAGRNIIPISTTLILASLGAFVGDIIGFWIGKYYNDRLRNIWPLSKKPQWVEMGEGFFKKHGGKSILLGRFIGPTRSSMPIFAGLLKMRWKNFLLAALPSAVLWAAAYIIPGLIIGAISLSLPKEKAATFSLIGLGLIVLLWLIFWAIQRFFVFIVTKTNKIIDISWSKLNRHHASKFIIRIITNQKNPLDHHQLGLVFLAFIALILFITIFIDVILHIGIYKLNAPLFHLIETIRLRSTDHIFIVLTLLGNKYVICTVGLLVAALLSAKRQWYACVHLLALMIMAMGSVWLFKHVYFSARPTGFMMIAENSSFPSGHTTLSISILGFISFLIAQSIQKKWHWIPYTITGILTLGVAVSRLYLGAHWICDVLAGICLAFFILLLTIVSYRRRSPSITYSHLWLSIIIFSIIVPLLMASLWFFNRTLYQYTPYFQERTVAMAEWLENPESYLPIYRLNRFAQPAQPFNIQLAGNLKTIQQLLLQNGWKSELTNKKIKLALQRFASKSPEQQIFFLNQLYRQKPPVLFFIKYIPNKNIIIELRLWNTGITFSDKKFPLFVGSIDYHKSANSLINFKPHLQISLSNGGGRKELIKDLGKKYKLTIRNIDEQEIPSKMRYLQWDGKIFIITENGAS